MSDDYGLSKPVEGARIAAPELPYLPPRPRAYWPKIGLIGAGGITEYHLRAYQRMGLEVVTICDLDLNKANGRRDAFYPAAATTTDFRDVLKRDDIEVVDIALHPEPRVAAVEAALEAGKHVLSQKPFATDLDTAQRLADRAAARGLKLAVNQNGRWAPHYAWLREAVKAGVVGDVSSIDFEVAWDHGWTVGTPFEQIHHLVLYDFGVHWFDNAACLLNGRAVKSVYAAVNRAAGQKAKPPFLASVVIQAEGAQVRMSFDATVVHGQLDRTLVAGTLGTMQATGTSLSAQRVTLHTAAGEAVPDLRGSWFENGFEGTMGELLCAIENRRDPFNSAANNLRTLELCFAALRSADTGLPVRPGEARSL